MSDLKNKFIKFMNQYSDELDEARKTQNFKRPFGDFVRKEIVEDIKEIVDQEHYYVKGSVGAGRWTDVPWIAVFDIRITKSAQKGVYIVYLLNKNSKELYLTLNQGATDVSQSNNNLGKDKLTFTGIASANNHATNASLKERASTIRQSLEKQYQYEFAEINTGSLPYDSGCIYYKKYTISDMPDEETLRKDLKDFLDIYQDYYEKIYLVSNSKNTDTLWWPSLDEYDPGISKETWKELLRDSQMFGPVWGGCLAMFYTERDGASCSSLGEKFNHDPASLRSSCVQLAQAVHKRLNCPLAESNGKKQFWPILFVGRKASSDEKGSWVWKLRDELYDAISESDIMKYLPKAEKSWLLTWNPANYGYSEYEEKRNDILNGKQYIDQWACSNTHVNIGDRVYMMRVGTGKRNGIIASGYAVRTSYSAPHYDPEKAASGETIKKIDVEFDCMLDRNGEKYLSQDTLKDLFPDQRWNPQSSGIAIKEEYRDDLEQEWLKYTDRKDIEDVEPMQITVKEAVEKIKTYIAAKGFSYNDGLIENFYLSLKSKPFVILAGTSGTGKTRLVKLFAEAISAKYKMIAVRPDWSDSSDLFGHVDLNGNYIPGAVLEFIAEAGRNPGKPYILCLDEMNLARVEYYLSDFLSVIETRDFDGNRVISDPLVSNEKYGSDEAARSKYGEIGFPENFYLVGTVNMDETTFPFSKKVLDRANTIEFNYVDLNPQELSIGEAEKQNLPNSFLRTEYLLLNQCEKDMDYVKTVSALLQKINELLQQANAHVGYRIRDEIVFYMLNNRETELLSEDDAFDNEIMQKILPRIQGSSVSVKDMLCELFKEFVGDYEGYQTQSDDTASMMLKKLKKDGARYPKSAEKTAFMVRRFEEDGFTSYWL